MDDIIVRTRYPRYNTPGRRKRKNTRDTGKLTGKIIKQLAVSILILLIIGAVKNIDTPVTNFLADKIKSFLYQDININGIYETIDNIIEKLRGSKGDAGESSGTEVTVEKNENNSTSNVANEDTKSPGNSVSIPELNEKYQFAIPVSGSISSQFGNRIHPITGEVELHKGIDIEASNGSPIKAVLEGEVIEASIDRTYGNYIKLKHADGIITIYAHCSKLIAKQGQYVKQGEVIAMVGDTGVSTGTHLHFEIWKDGEALNPADYIKFQ